MITKECGTCTRCCEGYLTADINGQKIGNGKSCIFVQIGKGCGDYENRPKDPCRDFKCSWLEIEDMPNEFKPEISGVIMQYKNNNGNPYFAISKAPKNPTEQFLSWALVYAIKNNANVVWYIDDKSYWLGNENFSNQMLIENP